MTDLGVPVGYSASYANSINSKGQVVGYLNLFVGSSVYFRGFVYTDGVMTDSDDLIDPSCGWTIEYANAINDDGLIVGQAYNSAIRSHHAFLLTPIPEPSTVILLAIAAISLVAYRRRRAA